MKYLIVKTFTTATIAVLIFATISCKKECEITNATCNETVPDEDCHAIFSGWFYDKSSDSCKEIGYSGCSQKGFATKQECETCVCEN